MTYTGEAPNTGPGGSVRAGRIYFVTAIVVAGVVLDQLTKLIAIKYLMYHPPIDFLGGWFRLQYATNMGAFLGIAANLPEWARFWVLTAFNAVILLGVAIYLSGKREIAFPVTLSLALILSGGVGNLIDRVFRDGKVIDFMNMGMGDARFPIIDLPVRTGIFNIADMAIMGGLFVLIANELFLRPGAAKQPEEERAGNGPARP